MKLKSLIIVCLCLCSFAYAQEKIQIKGKVVSAEDRKAVPFAYIKLKGIALGTVTEADGYFQIQIPTVHKNDTLVFSYVGFKPYYLKINDINDPTNVQVVMQVDTKVLSEVVIKPKKLIGPRALLRRVLSNIENNYPGTPFMIDGYYRETLQEHGAYIKYADAACIYHYDKYRLKKYKWNEYGSGWGSVNGSLSSLTSYWGARLHRGHFHHRTLRKDQVKIIDARASANLSKEHLEANIEGGPLGLLGKDRVKFRRHFLDKKYFGRYDYEVSEVNDEQDASKWYYCLTFKPSISLEKLAKKRKKFRLYRDIMGGKIYVDQKDYGIVKIEYSVPPDYKQYICSYTTMAIKHFDYKISISYKKQGDKYYIDHLRQEDEFIFKDTITNVTTPYAAVSELFVNEIITDSVKAIPKTETFANVDFNQLFDYPLEYNQEFWDDYAQSTAISIIPDQVRMDMESEKKLEQQFKEKHFRNDTMPIPVAKKEPERVKIHGDEWYDDYAWLKDTKAPLYNDDVVDYLRAENAFTDNYFIPLRKSHRNIFIDLANRIERNYESLPTKRDGYYYYLKYSSDQEHPVYFRKPIEANAKEEVIMDVNEMAQGKQYYSMGGYRISPDTHLMAFVENTDGSDKAVMKFKDLRTGQLLADSLTDISGFVWIDSKSFFYAIQEPKTNRSYKVMKHVLGTPQSSDKLVFLEKDERFSVGIGRSKSKQFIFMSIASSTTSEVYYLRTDNPQGEFSRIHKREEGHIYGVKHYKDKLYILTNKNAINNKIMVTDTSAVSYKNWKPFVAHRKDVLLNGFELFDKYYVLSEKSEALNRLNVFNKATGKSHYIKAKEDIATLSLGYNPDVDTDTLRYAFSSPSVSSEVYNYNMATKKQRLVKKRKAIGVLSSRFIEVERVWATARDGERIPVTLIYYSWSNPKKRKTKRMFLTSYGAYGAGMDVGYNSNIFSLLNKGFVYAIAHVRGGNDMGMAWYEDGKKLQKKNTFFDFIDCTEFLIAEEYAAKGQIVAYGGSAGGLLMGAVANMRPDLYKGIILNVPFVDVVNTMMDPNLPLTTLEYEEWGSPLIKKYYKYIKSYSPYDNVEAKEYPYMVFLTAINDNRVGYWEPAKMVAKLRAMKTDERPLLLKTNMEAGHGGSSGRYQRLRETAYIYALVFDMFSVKENENPTQ
ncbi:MAG: prolyl oligopeptidase family serine peptidase [Bacteroidota bacterium]